MDNQPFGSKIKFKPFSSTFIYIYANRYTRVHNVTASVNWQSIICPHIYQGTQCHILS